MKRALLEREVDVMCIKDKLFWGGTFITLFLTAYFIYRGWDSFKLLVMYWAYLIVVQIWLACPLIKPNLPKSG